MLKGPVYGLTVASVVNMTERQDSLEMLFRIRQSDLDKYV